jgi:hypothetical protein
VDPDRDDYDYCAAIIEDFKVRVGPILAAVEREFGTRVGTDHDHECDWEVEPLLERDWDMSL